MVNIVLASLSPEKFIRGKEKMKMIVEKFNDKREALDLVRDLSLDGIKSNFFQKGSLRIVQYETRGF